MLSFKEFVFASWACRSYGPKGAEAEQAWKMWSTPSPSNGWWIRYDAWVAHGGPMPVKDIEYQKLTFEQVLQHYDLPKPVEKEVKMTFEEFFVAKMNKVASIPGGWHIDQITKEILDSAGWKSLYQNYLDGLDVNLTVTSVQPKKQRRYLNRV